MKIHFSEILKNLRKEHGLKQTELAEMLFINKSMISAYEKGTRMPSLDVLIQISFTFNVSIDYLLGIERETVNDKERTIDISGLNDAQLNALLEVIKAFRQN